MQSIKVRKLCPCSMFIFASMAILLSRAGPVLGQRFLTIELYISVPIKIY